MSLAEYNRRRLIKGFALAPVVAAGAAIGVHHREHFRESGEGEAAAREQMPDDRQWFSIEAGIQTLINVRQGSISSKYLEFSIALSRLRLDAPISLAPWAHTSESEDGRWLKVTYVWDGSATSEAERDTAVAALSEKVEALATSIIGDGAIQPIRAIALKGGEEFNQPVIIT